MTGAIVILGLVLIVSIAILSMLFIIIKYMDKRNKGNIHFAMKFRSFEFEVDTSSEKVVENNKEANR